MGHSVVVGAGPRRQRPGIRIVARPESFLRACAWLAEDEAEQVQTEDECQRDDAEQEAHWSRTVREADRDRCESGNECAYLADPNHGRTGADEPRPRDSPQGESGDPKTQ